MSEKLLLPSAKVAVLVREEKFFHPYLRYAALGLGLVVILYGLADVTTRASHALFGNDAGKVAFAPAAVSVLRTTASGELIPARLKIPSIGVDAPVEQVGQKADGSMGTPTKFGDVAWYAPGPKPGGAGNAVIDGHVNNALTTAGVFEHLNQVKQGDYVTVTDANGKTLVYRVSSTQTLPAGADPAQVFSSKGASQLVLITCDGQWVSSEHQFDQRFVVFAKLSN